MIDDLELIAIPCGVLLAILVIAAWIALGVALRRR